MGNHVCPVWAGHLLLNPLRSLFENPKKLLGPFVQGGMVVLEPGCGMGFFTLPLARMVGPGGRVIAVDLQPAMLSKLEKRALTAGLAERVIPHLAQPETFELGHLSGTVEFTAAIHMVHEMPDQSRFFDEVWHALKPSGKLLIVEPRFHVSKKAFEQTVSLAEAKGFVVDTRAAQLGGRKCLFRKHREG